MSQERRPTTRAGAPDELPEYAERVLEVAELIPPGRVMTYGDVAEWLGEGGPRQVGRVMALYGGAVPWWRVVRADGVLLPGPRAAGPGPLPRRRAPRCGEAPRRRRATCRASTCAGALGRRRRTARRGHT